MTGEALRDFRRRHGLSLAALGRELGCSVNTLRGWEARAEVPKLVALALEAVAPILRRRLEWARDRKLIEDDPAALDFYDRAAQRARWSEGQAADLASRAEVD